MPPSPQPKLRQGSAAACTGAGGLGGLQPLGAEYSSHSRSQFSQPPLARTSSGGSNSNHRVRKFVIGGGAIAAVQQCPVTPVPAATPLAAPPAPGSAMGAPAPLTHEAEKENVGFPNSTGGGNGSSSTGVTAAGGGSAGKAQRKRSERVNVRLLPLDAATETRIRRAGYNPKLELSTPVRAAFSWVWVCVFGTNAALHNRGRRPHNLHLTDKPTTSLPPTQHSSPRRSASSSATSPPSGRASPASAPSASA